MALVMWTLLRFLWSDCGISKWLTLSLTPRKPAPLFLSFLSWDTDDKFPWCSPPRGENSLPNFASWCSIGHREHMTGCPTFWREWGGPPSWSVNGFESKKKYYLGAMWWLAGARGSLGWPRLNFLPSCPHSEHTGEGMRDLKECSHTEHTGEGVRGLRNENWQPGNPVRHDSKHIEPAITFLLSLFSVYFSTFSRP